MEKVKNWLLLLVIFSAFVIFSCGGDKKGKNKEVLQAKGGRVYGGVFRLNETEYFKNLYPLNVIDAIAARITTQIYEGLMKFNLADLTTKMSLAESYAIDTTGRIYTFKIKKGVIFHDDECFSGGKGRELKANDFKYCFDRLCTKDVNNNSFPQAFKDRVLGANEHYESPVAGGVKGIRVVDEYTIEITLIKPYSPFLQILALPSTVVYPKEAIDKYGPSGLRAKAVGTGPFILKSVDDDVSVVMARNSSYHGADEFGNKLPFLDAIQLHFISDKKTELFEFKKGNLEMIYRLPTEYIIDILTTENTNLKGEYVKYELQRGPEMSVQYYDFLNTAGVFKNKKVRQAFNYAIDRQKIIDFVLNGAAEEVGIGITPPTFKGYDIHLLPGFRLDVDKAKQLLAEAGYPNGRSFPKLKLDINSGGGLHVNVGEEIVKQLKDHLNIDIELNILSFAQKIDKSQKGQSDIWRAGWIADFPSPENFLWLMYGKDVPDEIGVVSYPNTSRFKNAEFDKLYEMALNSKTLEESYKHFMDAEKIMLDESPILPLYYDESYRILQSYVKNFPNNAMQFRDFSEVYLDKSAKADTSKSSAEPKKNI